MGPRWWSVAASIGPTSRVAVADTDTARRGRAVPRIRLRSVGGSHGTQHAPASDAVNGIFVGTDVGGGFSGPIYSRFHWMFPRIEAVAAAVEPARIDALTGSGKSRLMPRWASGGDAVWVQMHPRALEGGPRGSPLPRSQTAKADWRLAPTSFPTAGARFRGCPLNNQAGRKGAGRKGGGM